MKSHYSAVLSGCETIESQMQGHMAAHLNAEIAFQRHMNDVSACMEWLRKIAEVNPDFKVITFSDTTCDSAIITPIDYLTV